jgi:hypothetical protein
MDKKTGRPYSYTDKDRERILKYRAQKKSVREIEKIMVTISKSAIHRVIQEAGA